MILTDEENRKLYPEFYGKHYIFFRKECFYPIELGSDEQAVENALCNPGTIKVEDINRNVIWQLN